MRDVSSNQAVTESLAPAPVEIREKPDGAADPAGEAGWYLEHERLSRGETLDDAAAQTGIHPYHLEAIEYGDMTRMPGRVDALEMIGTYAHYLGFDPEPLVQHYAHFLPSPELAPKPSHPANPAPLSSAKILRFGKLPQLPKFTFKLKVNGFPGGAGGLVASLAGAVFLFAGVSYMLLPGSDAQAPLDQVADIEQAIPEDPSTDPMPTASTGEQTAEVSIGEEPMPDDQSQLASAADDAGAAAAAAAEASSDDLAGTNLDGISNLIEQEVPGAKDASSTLEGMVSAAEFPVTDEGRQFGAENGESRLTLKAKAPVWVRIEDSQGNVVMTQMLMKGDTYRVPNRQGLVVIARDGGLLSYVIDGKEKGILGTPGEILVGRSLDVTSFEG
jgi:cytoskeleton protein RodZ